ncbi:MAG: YbaN family protein [Planctomycetaceae bacterium]
MVRLGIILIGWLAVALAIVGAVLPLMPTTPFALFAAACFAKVSPRSYEWLLRTPILGEAIQDWQAFRGLRLSTKKRAGLMAGMTATMSVAGGPLAIMIALLGCAILAVILFRIPSLSEESSC